MRGTLSTALSAGARVWFGAGAAYLCILVPAAVFGFGALALPCDGFLCNIGYAVVGVLAGGALGVVVLAVVAVRLGLRWWFVPVLLAVLAAGVLLLTTFDGVPARAGVLLAVLAPMVAALTAAGLSRRRVVVGVAALAALLAVGVAVLTLGDHLERRDELQRRAEQFRASGLPLFAPTDLDAAELRLVYARPDQVMYDLRTPEHTGWLRIVLAPASTQHCGVGNVTDLGDRTFALGHGQTFRRVCRELGEVNADLWPDGPSDWTGDEMVEVAKLLEPADAQWFADRQA